MYVIGFCDGSDQPGSAAGPVEHVAGIGLVLVRQAPSAKRCLALQLEAMKACAAFLPVRPTRPIPVDAARDGVARQPADLLRRLDVVRDHCEMQVQLRCSTELKPVASLKERAARKRAERSVSRSVDAWFESIGPITLRNWRSRGPHWIGAFLVPRNSVAVLQTALEETPAPHIGPSCSVLLTGPWPVLSFAEEQSAA